MTSENKKADGLVRGVSAVRIAVAALLAGLAALMGSGVVISVVVAALLHSIDELAPAMILAIFAGLIAVAAWLTWPKRRQA